MKQILITSGKGGTGKTTVTGALASLAENKVIADCDVDAADLHILLAPDIHERHIFKSGYTPRLSDSLCTRCDACRTACRFDAITINNTAAGTAVTIDPVACEGCGLCRIVCPAGAITMQENEAGEWFVSATRLGPLVHAQLGIAEENSGKLVTQVRKKARELAEARACDWVLIDGAPGTGCPVIASLAGIDLAVVVTEPTLSGLHDARRVIEVARHFSVPVAMIINKYDLNETMAAEIETYCAAESIPVIGRIAFDKAVVEALMAEKTIIEYGASATASAVRDIWQAIRALTAGDTRA